MPRSLTRLNQSNTHFRSVCKIVGGKIMLILASSWLSVRSPVRPSLRMEKLGSTLNEFSSNLIIQYIYIFFFRKSDK
jgi:hypothetical protein